LNRISSPENAFTIYDTELEDDDEEYSNVVSLGDEVYLRVRKVSFQTRSYSIDLESGYPEEDLDKLTQKALYLIENAKTVDV
jgi:hypothetical protein